MNSGSISSEAGRAAHKPRLMAPPRIKLTNMHPDASALRKRLSVLGSFCSGDLPGLNCVQGTNKRNIRSLLLTFEALAELGSEMTASRDFSETARIILDALLQAVGAREGALFTFTVRPAILTSLAVRGFTQVPSSLFIPLLPRHVNSLVNLRTPQPLATGHYAEYLTTNGNISPELFRVIAPLRVAGRLVGMVALGHRDQEGPYHDEDLDGLGLLDPYVALAVHNHELTQSLEQRISDHLRLLGSMHQFYDNALEVFAAASDIKHVNVRGHSARVARYAAGISEAMGLDSTETAAIKASGYLHDIGMIAVDKAIFAKPAALDEREFREMADHTVVGHSIVADVEFPWANIPAVVRGHHERADGSGYPDHLHGDEISLPARVVAVADMFDALVSERAWRQAMNLGSALAELVRLTPQKLDAAAVQALLVQIRRDTVGSNSKPFLDERVLCLPGAADIDNFASLLQYKLNNGRAYSA